MNNPSDAQVSRIMIALIGMSDPETDLGPTAPVLIYRQEKPKVVYLIPTKDSERTSSYGNAQKTQSRLEEEGCPQVRIMPVSLGAALDEPSRLFPEMMNILREIENGTRSQPNRRFVICPVSGLPRMRDTLKTLLERKAIRNFQVYDIQLSEHGPAAIPIWSEIHEPRVGLFVDADCVAGVLKSVRAIKQAAEELGSVEEAWAFANWFAKSREVAAYYQNGFRPVTLPVAPEISDINLFTFIGESLEYRDNDIYVIVSHDTRFHNGVAAILGHGKEVHFWIPHRDSHHESFGILDGVQRLHPERLHLKYLDEVLSQHAKPKQVRRTEGRKLHAEPVKNAIVTSITPQGVLSTLCAIRLEPLSLKDITMYFSLDSLYGQPLQESVEIYLIALSDHMARPAAWFRFLDKIGRTKKLTVRVINLNESVDRNLPRRDPSWRLWSEPRLSSYGDLLRRKYGGRVNTDELAELCVEALSAGRGAQASDLLEKATTAAQEGPQQVMAFLKRLVTGGIEALHR